MNKENQRLVRFYCYYSFKNIKISIKRKFQLKLWKTLSKSILLDHANYSDNGKRFSIFFEESTTLIVKCGKLKTKFLLKKIVLSKERM